MDYKLSEAETATLIAVTKDAAARAGALGGSIGGAIGGGAGGIGGAGAGEFGGRSGGARGARYGVRFTKPLTGVTTFELPDPPTAVGERARTALAGEGQLIDDPNGAGDGSVWGIVAPPHLMPALVRVAIEPNASGGSQVEVRGSAQEGLIKVHVGAKAADRIAAAIGGG